MESKKIKAYPLIYSATKFADYVYDGIVRPEDINTEEASKYMVASMYNVKFSASKIRHCIFKAGEYAIYGGTACVPYNLIEKIKKVEKIENLGFDYEDYLTDKDNRPMIFFIGFAVKLSDIPKGKTIKISLLETYKQYIECIKGQWRSINTDYDFSKTVELKLVDYKPNNQINFEPIKSYENINFIDFDEENYQDYIDYFFTEMIKNPDKDFSFISDVLTEDIKIDYPFKNISLCGGTVDDAIECIKNSQKPKEVPAPIEPNNDSDGTIPSQPQPGDIYTINNNDNNTNRDKKKLMMEMIKENIAKMNWKKIATWIAIAIAVIAFLIILSKNLTTKATETTNNAKNAESDVQPTNPTEQNPKEKQINMENKNNQNPENPAPSPQNLTETQPEMNNNPQEITTIPEHKNNPQEATDVQI